MTLEVLLLVKKDQNCLAPSKKVVRCAYGHRRSAYRDQGDKCPPWQVSKVVQKEAEITLELENDSTCGIVSTIFLHIQSKRDRNRLFWPTNCIVDLGRTVILPNAVCPPSCTTPQEETKIKSPPQKIAHALNQPIRNQKKTKTKLVLTK